MDVLGSNVKLVKRFLEEVLGKMSSEEFLGSWEGC
jgi:hypothetical protein